LATNDFAIENEQIIESAYILVAPPKRNGGAVVGEGAPARWRLKEATN
jgi:hypothetical protein